MLVTMLDEQPVPRLTATRRTVCCPDEREASAQLATVEHNVDLAASELPVYGDVVCRFVPSPVPDHHRPRAILTFRDDALEIRVLERMVLSLHRQPLVCRIHRWPFGHGP